MNKNMANLLSTVFFFISVFLSTAYGDYCYRSSTDLDYDYDDDDDDYCPFGCCGDIGNEYCCSYAGPIVGIVFGMIAFIGIIIVVTICRRRRYNSGVVVRTGGLINNGLVTTSQMQSGTVMQASPVQYPAQVQYPPTQQMGAYPQPPPAYEPK